MLASVHAKQRWKAWLIYLLNIHTWWCLYSLKESLSWLWTLKSCWYLSFLATYFGYKDPKAKSCFCGSTPLSTPTYKENVTLECHSHLDATLCALLKGALATADRQGQTSLNFLILIFPRSHGVAQWSLLVEGQAASVKLLHGFPPFPPTITDNGTISNYLENNTASLPAVR